MLSIVFKTLVQHLVLRYDINIVNNCDIYDNTINSDSYDCSKGTYYLFGGLSTFLVSEIEVFQKS